MTAPRVLTRRWTRTIPAEGCRWCGERQRDHCVSWVRGHGWHGYVPPTQDQIHARMRARLMPECSANITDHDPVFAPAACIVKGAHDTHRGVNGETWTDPPPTAPAKELP